MRVGNHAGAAPGDAEFTFELLVSRWAELAWPPDDSAPASAVVVARQLGTSDRRWDTVVVECDPDGLAARLALGERGLDSDLVHVVRNAPATWAYYREALPDPGYPWSYVRAAVHRGADRGLVETRKRSGRVELRRVQAYPEWVRRIVAVENKPDLDAAAARALSDQLTHDVHAGLADEVWLATAATGADVEPALLADVPVEAGVVAVDATGGLDADAATVEWRAGDLDAPDPHAAPSVKAGRGEDAAAVTERDRLAARRLELAERAFDRGWRSFVDTMRPDCRAFELRRHGRALVPYCTAKECHQTAGECAGSCGAFSPEPPSWRTRQWPVDGGPGAGVQALLDRRRERARRRAGGDGTAASEDRTPDGSTDRDSRGDRKDRENRDD
ncbi:MAG: DUF5787 family protein [Halolamina sp.]